MLDVLSITGPIYLTIAIGYLATRLGLFAKADMRVFGKFVIQLALPALLFNALSQRRLGEILNGSYLLVYALGSLAVVAAGVAWAHLRSGKPLDESSYVAMGMACSNSGFVGYPMVLLLLGPVAGVALALNMVVENLLVIPILLMLADAGVGAASGKRHWGRAVVQTLAQQLRNPLLVAIVSGFVFSLMGWQLPGPVARTVNLFSQASGALALFVIGGTLVGLEVKGMRAQVAQIAFGKLILHPLTVLAALWLVPIDDPQLRTAVILSAAMPMMGIYPILAQRHGHEGNAAAALLVTTVASFFTLSGLLWVLKHPIT
ncbi:MAG: hypothetical protein RLZZ591_2256 [Pseudomonadota bacterium]|jgi:predicted permease